MKPRTALPQYTSQSTRSYGRELRYDIRFGNCTLIPLDVVHTHENILTIGKHLVSKSNQCMYLDNSTCIASAPFQLASLLYRNPVYYGRDSLWIWPSVLATAPLITSVGGATRHTVIVLSVSQVTLSVTLFLQRSLNSSETSNASRTRYYLAFTRVFSSYGVICFVYSCWRSGLLQRQSCPQLTA